MKGKKEWYREVTTILILVFSAFVLFTAVASADGLPCACGDICVNETGWWRGGGDFNASNTPIQHAIDNATAGETICVKDGTYNENVDVNKRLTVRSENGSANCIVNASNYNDHVFEVTSNYVNISGFTVTGATRNSTNALYMKAGVCLGDTEHGDLSDINATNNFNGIQLRNSSNNTLVNNTANSNEYSGIFLFFSNDTTITGNTANSNYHVGIFLCEFNNNNTVTGNNVSNNGEYGICLYSSSNNNVVDGNNASNNGDRGIYLSTSSNNNNITNNTANSNSDYGIYLRVSCNYNTLTNNTASNNNYGIWLSSSSYNTLTGNTASNNGAYSIYLNYADNNNITCNLVHNNTEAGFYLANGSTGNTIERNNIVENGAYNETSGGWEWNFHNEQSANVEAKYNWWGTAVSLEIAASINEDTGSVDYSGYLDGPSPCAPSYRQPAPAPIPAPAFSAIGLLALIAILSVVLAVATSRMRK